MKFISVFFCLFIAAFVGYTSAAEKTSNNIEVACKKAAKSRLRYYSYEYTYYDCLSFLGSSSKVTPEQISACSDSTMLTSSFFECLTLIKESNNIDKIKPELIYACKNNTSFFSFQLCVSEITSYPDAFTPDKIKECNEGKKSFKDCLIDYRAQYLGAVHENPDNTINSSSRNIPKPIEKQTEKEEKKATSTITK